MFEFTNIVVFIRPVNTDREIWRSYGHDTAASDQVTLYCGGLILSRDHLCAAYITVDARPGACRVARDSRDVAPAMHPIVLSVAG